MPLKKPLIRPFIQTLISSSALMLMASSFALAEIDNASGQKAPLALSTAYQNALDHAMRIKSAQAEVGIKQAERLQVSLYPNPQLNIALDGPSNATPWNNDCNDISLGLTQLFELGGKRHARVRVADAISCETGWDLEILKCDLYSDILHAFIKVAIAQERLALAADLSKLSEQNCRCIYDKATFGKASPLDVKRAEINSRTTQLAYNKRLNELEKAKIELASLWNASPQFDEVNYPLFNIHPPQPYECLAEELHSSPELTRSHAELFRAWEMIELERANRIPDLALYVGVCTQRNFHDPSLSLGVTIPLPVFDRNQGNIARASHEFNQVTFRQMDLLNTMQVRLRVLYREWANAYEQTAEFSQVLQTTAAEAHQLAEERYNLGSSEFLEFLEIKTSLFNIKQQYLEAIEEYHHKRAEILRLVAKCCFKSLD